MGPNLFGSYTHLEMDQCWFLEFLVWCQSLVDDRVRAFGVQLDSTVWPSDDCGHPLSGRVELADIEHLVLFRPTVHINKDRFGLSRLAYLISDMLKVP